MAIHHIGGGVPTPRPPRLPRLRSKLSLVKLYPGSTKPIYYVTMAALLATAIWIIMHTGSDVWHHRRSFAQAFPIALGGIILTVIILEILETVYRQVTDEGERLSLRLVNSFFVIGAVSAVRHILVIGAQLSLPGENINTLVGELRINVLLVGILIIGILTITVATRFVPVLQRPASKGINQAMTNFAARAR